MNKPVKPIIIKSNDRNRKTAKQSNNDHAAVEGVLSAKAIDALTDIVKRSNRLIRLLSEKSRADDGYQVIDPRTVAATFYDILQKATLDPAHIVNEQFRLWAYMTLLWQRTATRALFKTSVEPVILPDPQDKRFKNEVWIENQISDYIKQYYLLMSRYFLSSVQGIKRVDPHTLHQAKFYVRQFVNALSPTNFVATNPTVFQTTIASHGENLLCGLRNLLEDLERGGGRLNLKMSDSSAFRFGDNLAISPGKVIYQNDLMQLIQYSPTTPTVYRRPLLIVPPWINKFYILDLKPKNSFIKWCVEQGHTVFLISWVNPGPELANKGFSDYFLDGPMAAIDAIKRATGESEVNVIGYCIGGTLTATALAFMAATNSNRIASATLFTTLLDFSDVGDISAFIDDAQLRLLEEHMNRLGYLEGHQMAEAFNLLRENDLIWFFVVNNYLMGREPSAFDLLFWNSDSTRMPTAMHSFYLRNMYHRNILKDVGGITIASVPIDLRKIDVPVYFVATCEDHIAPWRSIYAGARLVSGPVRFILGASGHVAGVINPPSANKYGYWTNGTMTDRPECWLDLAEFHQGSWWIDWAKWIADFGGGQTSVRQPGSGELAPIEDAPGSYVSKRSA